MSWTNRPHMSTHPQPHPHKHALPPSLLLCQPLSILPPYPHLFLGEDDMGDPDVTSHWPMVSREGLDWRPLLMPPSFKYA